MWNKAGVMWPGVCAEGGACVCEREPDAAFPAVVL